MWLYAMYTAFPRARTAATFLFYKHLYTVCVATGRCCWRWRQSSSVAICNAYRNTWRRWRATRCTESSRTCAAATFLFYVYKLLKHNLYYTELRNHIGVTAHLSLYAMYTDLRVAGGGRRAVLRVPARARRRPLARVPAGGGVLRGGQRAARARPDGEPISFVYY
jgi:hypothetical protein